MGTGRLILKESPLLKEQYTTTSSESIESTAQMSIIRTRVPGNMRLMFTNGSVRSHEVRLLDAFGLDEIR